MKRSGSQRSGIRRGAVVQYWKYGGWQKGIVLRLKRPRDGARGAEVLNARGPGIDYVFVQELILLGHVKRIPKLGQVDVPPHPDQIAHHEKIRDIRRHGQGAYYDPQAPHNRPFEAPLPPSQRTILVRPTLRRRKRR